MFVESRKSARRQSRERHSRRPRENFQECRVATKNNHRHLIHCFAVKRTTAGPTRQLDIRRNLFAFRIFVRIISTMETKKVQFLMNHLKTRSDVTKLRKSKLSLGRRIGIINFSVLRTSCSLVGRYRSFGPPHFFFQFSVLKVRTAH